MVDSRRPARGRGRHVRAAAAAAGTARTTLQLPAPHRLAGGFAALCAPKFPSELRGRPSVVTSQRIALRILHFNGLCRPNGRFAASRSRGSIRGVPSARLHSRRPVRAAPFAASRPRGSIRGVPSAAAPFAASRSRGSIRGVPLARLHSRRPARAAPFAASRPRGAARPPALQQRSCLLPAPRPATFRPTLSTLRTAFECDDHA
jgi:hypothetical protein